MQNSQAIDEAMEGSVNKVEVAEAEVAELQRRVERERQAFAQGSANLIASTTHFDLQVCQHMLQLVGLKRSLKGLCPGRPTWHTCDYCEQLVL